MQLSKPASLMTYSGDTWRKIFFKTSSIVLSKKLYSYIFPRLKLGNNNHFPRYQSLVQTKDNGKDW